MDSNIRGELATSFLILLGVLAALGLIGGGSYLYFKDDEMDVPVAPGECECPNQLDIKSRIAEATAARDKFAERAADRSYKDDISGKAEMYTDGAKVAETNQVDPLVKKATLPGAHTGSGETGGEDCVTKIKAPNDCLRAALQMHENVHSLTCQQMKKDGRVDSGGDYKRSMTMVTFLRNEVAGYQAEIDYLTQEMNRLKNDSKCKWVVMETYPGPASKEDQQQRLAGAERRVGMYAKGIS